jgi:hypothetical protein
MTSGKQLYSCSHLQKSSQKMSAVFSVEVLSASRRQFKHLGRQIRVGLRIWRRQVEIEDIYIGNMCLFLSLSLSLFPLRCFYPIPGHGLPLWGFAITSIGHTRLGRTPLDEWSTRRSDLYKTTHNAHKRHISIQPAGFEPTIPASERPQTHALDRAATGTDNRVSRHVKMRLWRSKEPLANTWKLLLCRRNETGIFEGVPLHRSWTSTFLSSNI